ncbi:LAGLIDADG family homing endonuclease [Streptomyces fungicidicus]|uniref:LAGLIDADG family homing endonuclease n=1 Tax=Streptomyces fungicidicus TaxID=68203 RepID=UPI003D73BAFB
MRGFSSAEGCFLVNLPKSQNNKLKMKVQLVFQLTQHSRDEKLMRSFIDFFDCGNIFKDGNNFVFRVTKFNDIESRIIPFFRNYLILGVKYEDFKDFA